MMNTSNESIPSFPIQRECPFKVSSVYGNMDRIGRVRMADGRVAWVVTKINDARTVLSDRRFSSEKLRPGFPELAPGGLKKLNYFAPFLVNEGYSALILKNSNPIVAEMVVAKV